MGKEWPAMKVGWISTSTTELKGCECMFFMLVTELRLHPF
jgi:hypothetical protein